LTGYNENATLPFEAGKTYRVRLINMSALSMYHFWIEGHDMNVIEADGVDTEAHSVDLVSVAVAQRYSLLITARNDSSENWLIHANLDPEMYDQVPDSLQLNLTSTISYKNGNPMGSDRATVDAYSYFDDTALVPVVPMPMVEADFRHDLSFEFNTYRDGKNYAAFNGKSYVSPLTPTLLTAQSMPLNETSDAAVYGPNTGVVILPHMDMIEITIYNTDAGSHPIHIHGTQFQVVHKSQDVTSSDPSINPPFVEGQLNPMRRDTIQIPAGGSSTLRFRADNPGVWFVHCHIGEQRDKMSVSEPKREIQ
jgi:iron transport multicopper oxidase